jgi:adenosylmethionine-8-amino-7-oxononanoate aminotransferase
LLRHLGRGDLSVEGKERGVWRLSDGTRLHDLSGGPLVQTLAEVPAPPPELVGRVSGPGGVETAVRRRFEEQALDRAGGAAGGALWGTSGSDAVEAALWACGELLRSEGADEPIVHVVREGGYHGNTELTRRLSTRGGGSGPSSDDAPLRRVVREPAGTAEETTAEVLSQMEAISAEGRGRPVVILETVPTTGPVFWPGADHYQRILARCATAGIPVILDEVASGAYRHGWWSAFEWIAREAAPAAVVLSKGLTCGVYPLSCAVLRRDVADVLRARRKLPAFTFGLTDPAAWSGTECLRRFDEIAAAGGFEERCETVRNWRDELAGAGRTVEATDTTLRVLLDDPAEADRVRSRLRERGAVTYFNAVRLGERSRPAVFCCPPLDVSAATARRLFEVFAESVGE